MTHPELHLPTPAQQNLDRTRTLVKHWHADPETLYLGAATTDLKGAPVEFIVLNRDGQVIHQEIVLTPYPINPDAQAYHQISSERRDAEGVPYPQALVNLQQVLAGRNPVCFQPYFIDQAIRYAAEGHHMRTGEILELPNTKSWFWGQVKLSTVYGKYSHTKEKFDTLPLTGLELQSNMRTRDLAPRGTALGNIQRVQRAVAIYAGASDLTATLEIQNCPRCNAPEDLCTCHTHEANDGSQE